MMTDRYAINLDNLEKVIPVLELDADKSERLRQTVATSNAAIKERQANIAAEKRAMKNASTQAGAAHPTNLKPELLPKEKKVNKR